jgi:hypothetical protein
MKTLFKIIMAFAVMMASTFAFAGECTQPHQEGCYDVVALNIKHSASTKGLENPPADDSQIIYRKARLGNDLWGAYQNGTVEAAKSARKILYFVWGIDAPPNAYRIDGKKIHRTSFEDVTAMIQPPSFEGSKGLGAPKVYSVQTEGKSAIGVSLQFSSSKITAKTFILVCSGDDLTVYPAHGAKEKKQGLWFDPIVLAELKAQGVRSSFAPIVSKE